MVSRMARLALLATLALGTLLAPPFMAQPAAAAVAERKVSPKVMAAARKRADALHKAYLAADAQKRVKTRTWIGISDLPDCNYTVYADFVDGKLVALRWVHDRSLTKDTVLVLVDAAGKLAYVQSSYWDNYVSSATEYFGHGTGVIAVGDVSDRWEGPRSYQIWAPPTQYADYVAAINKARGLGLPP